eukprot:2794728-Rhodomonas_salina.2
MLLLHQYPRSNRAYTCYAMSSTAIALRSASHGPETGHVIGTENGHGGTICTRCEGWVEGALPPANAHWNDTLCSFQVQIGPAYAMSGAVVHCTASGLRQVRDWHTAQRYIGLRACARTEIGCGATSVTQATRLSQVLPMPLLHAAMPLLVLA